MVPVLGPGKDWVAGEHAHSEKFWVGVLLSGEGSAYNVKLSDLKIDKR